MRTECMAMATMITVLLVVTTGCATTAGASEPTDARVEVSIDEFTNENHIAREVEVEQGGIVTVVLGSNPTTGFRWSEDAAISNSAILRQAGSEMVTAESEGMVGTPGSHVWTFTATEKGTAAVTMEYGRPWEGGEKAVWTFELTVTVK